MSVCINCFQQHDSPPGHMCAECRAAVESRMPFRNVDRSRLEAAIMKHVSAEDAQKPIDQLGPRTIEFEVPK